MSGHSPTVDTWEIWIRPPGEFPPYLLMGAWGELRTAEAVRESLTEGVREYSELYKVTRKRVFSVMEGS